MIGLFDSGLGGLTVLRRVRELLPDRDIMYFADQAHVPYGDREPGDLIELLRQNVAFLNSRGADSIVMACNTSCATAAELGWPDSDAPILDLIESAAMAIERGGFKRVGVVATAATARSRAYTAAIARHVPDAKVFEVGAPALVPLVEAGKIEGAQPRAAVAEVCARLPADLDAVILACTHYPLLDAHFAAVLGEGVARIDPAIAHAERAAAIEIDSQRAGESGTVTCITSGDLDRFETAVRKTLPHTAGFRFEQLVLSK